MLMLRWEMLLCWVGAGKEGTAPASRAQARGWGSCDPAWRHKNSLISAAGSVALTAKPTRRVEHRALQQGIEPLVNEWRLAGVF